MHEYRRFIQQNLDSRGWKPAELVRKSGLSRQLINKILNDKRKHLGQMPDDSTMEGIAKGFAVPVEVVRTAAARSLAGYEDDGSALTPTLQDVHLDALLNEIRRRVRDLEIAAQSPTSATIDQNEEALFPDELEDGGGIDADVGSLADDAGVDGAEDGEQREDLAGG